MAVDKLQIEAKKGYFYTALSSDAKPTPSSTFWGTRYPSYLIETDTGDTYKYQGSGIGWVRIEAKGKPFPVDTLLDTPAGNIDGYSAVNKFGASSNVADGTEEEVWDGAVAYTWPTSASITHVRSAVDSATTQGMVIEVQGVDTNYDLTVQNATLDGTNSTTEVALTTALRRVFRIKVLDANAADQDIWAGPTGFATQQAIVQAGNNQTLMAIYTVPNNKTAYITKYYGTIIGEAGPPAVLPDYVLFKLWNRDNANGYAAQLKHQVGVASAGTSIIEHEFKPYVKVTEKTDIYMAALPDGDDAYVSAGFDMILVDD